MEETGAEPAEHARDKERVMGTKKTLVFVALAVVMATISGMLFGLIAR